MQIFKQDAFAIDPKQLTTGGLNLRQLLAADRPHVNDDSGVQGPQAFLARFLPVEAGGSIPRHSYPFPQFQVVVRGEATFGRHLVRPGSFHYSDPGSVSGPITPLDPEIGLTYFTLRPANAISGGPATPSKGAGPAYAPRSIVGSRIPSRPRTEVLVSELVGPEDDGLGVCSIAVPPNATFTPLQGVSHGGTYLVVLEGTLSLAGEDLPAGSLVYLASDELADFTAATDGSELLLLQFPTTEHSP